MALCHITEKRQYTTVKTSKINWTVYFFTDLYGIVPVPPLYICVPIYIYIYLYLCKCDYVNLPVTICDSIGVVVNIAKHDNYLIVHLEVPSLSLASSNSSLLPDGEKAQG